MTRIRSARESVRSPTSTEDVQPNSGANHLEFCHLLLGIRVALRERVPRRMPRRRMNQLRNVLRYVVMSAGLLAGLAVTGGSRADAGVSFSGTLPLPHGQISIGIGDPYFHVGAFVPVGHRVYARSGYGYGFAYNNRWIPVRRYGDDWRVCESPYFDDVYYDDVYYEPYYGAGYG